MESRDVQVVLSQCFPGVLSFTLQHCRTFIVSHSTQRLSWIDFIKNIRIVQHNRMCLNLSFWSQSRTILLILSFWCPMSLLGLILLHNIFFICSCSSTLYSWIILFIFCPALLSYFQHSICEPHMMFENMAFNHLRRWWSLLMVLIYIKMTTK